MKIALMIIVSFLIIIVGSIFYLSSNHSDIAKQRPAGLPASAIWAGGVDGGHWFHLVLQTSTPDRFYFEIFTDHDGAKISEGAYIVDEKSGCNIPSMDNLPGTISWFDGKNIILRNKCKLIPDGFIFYQYGFKIKYKNGEQVSGKIPTDTGNSK